LRRAAAEEPDPAVVAFFGKILHVTNEDAFHTGAWALLEVTAEGDATSGNLIAYEWRSDTAWKIIVTNLSGGASQGRIPLGERVSASKQYIFDDQLNGAQYQRDGNELHGIGLFVRRDAFGAHLFDVHLL